jgi:hypothetical protein
MKIWSAASTTEPSGLATSSSATTVTRDAPGSKGWADRLGGGALPPSDPSPHAARSAPPEPKHEGHPQGTEPSPASHVPSVLRTLSAVAPLRSAVPERLSSPAAMERTGIAARCTAMLHVVLLSYVAAGFTILLSCSRRQDPLKYIISPFYDKLPTWIYAL